MPPGGATGLDKLQKICAMDTKLIFSCFLERVEARNRMCIIISCQEKNPEQKIFIFHDEKLFSKFSKYFLEIEKFSEKRA